MANNSSSSLEEFMTHARERVDDILKSNGIRKTEIFGGVNLSKATIVRRLDPDNHHRYSNIQEWIRDIGPIYERINEVLAAKGRATLTWEEFFG
jgi:hypothetical protein